MKQRFQVKHDTAENWAKAVNFVPLSGELIVYDGVLENGEYTVKPKIKIGDGIHTVNELPFIDLNQQVKYQYENGKIKIG